MKNNRLMIGFAIIIFFSGSCEKEVILDLADKEGAYLIVEANIDNLAKNQFIKLSLSSSYYEVTSGPPVSNASVKISGGGAEFNFTESPVDSLKGLYFNDIIAGSLKEGINYRLRIVKDSEVYTARSVLQSVPDIDSVSLELNLFTSMGIISDTLYDALIHFSTLPGNDAHYLVDLDINERLQTFRPSQKTVISTESLDEYVSLAVKTINKDNLEPGDTINVKLRSISKEQYDFYQIFFFQTDLSGNPFAGAPPANIPTNLSEGARGFFQVSSVSSARTKFP
ncbi:MAG: DUF4249 domain-containing protein [Bacteroidales bacterium]